MVVQHSPGFKARVHTALCNEAFCHSDRCLVVFPLVLELGRLFYFKIHSIFANYFRINRCEWAYNITVHRLAYYISVLFNPI